MAIYFFDSSGIVKRYVDEIGTPRVVEITRPENGHRIYLAQIAGVEVVSALTRLTRANQLVQQEGKKAIEQFRHDYLHQYRTIKITPKLIDSAMAIAEQYALRGYDAVQLAVAAKVHTVCKTLEISSPILISSDLALNDAAKQEGITVEDPNA